MLAKIGSELGGVDLNFERDRMPLEPAEFG